MSCLGSVYPLVFGPTVFKPVSIMCMPEVSQFLLINLVFKKLRVLDIVLMEVARCFLQLSKGYVPVTYVHHEARLVCQFIFFYNNLQITSVFVQAVKDFTFQLDSVMQASGECLFWDLQSSHHFVHVFEGGVGRIYNIYTSNLSIPHGILSHVKNN